jgi:hypothetical protein
MDETEKSESGAPILYIDTPTTRKTSLGLQ